MMVLDASVVLADVLPDESSDEADAIIAYMGEQRIIPLVPAHFMLEYTNGILVAKRRKRIHAHEVRMIMDEWLDAPLEIDNDADMAIVFAMADKYGLTMYDAAYLELAVRRKAKLATLDTALYAAAKKEKVAFKA